MFHSHIHSYHNHHIPFESEADQSNIFFGQSEIAFKIYIQDFKHCFFVAAKLMNE